MMIHESVKIDKSVIDRVRKLKAKDWSISIGGYFAQAVIEKLERDNPTRKSKTK